MSNWTSTWTSPRHFDPKVTAARWHAIPCSRRQEERRASPRTGGQIGPDGQAGGARSRRNDFIDLGLWLQLDTLPLRPKLEYAHYLRVDDRNGQQAAFEDIYLRLSVRHDFEPFEHLMLMTSGSIV